MPMARFRDGQAGRDRQHMPEEIFDVVDEQDRVIGQLPRSEVHARKLLHRAVHIFVFNSRGQLLIHRRSATKDEYPLCYTSSASGHLSAGETYEGCAPREMREEIGLTAPLTFLHKFPASPETAYEHTVLYQAVTDDPPTFDPDEIESGNYYELAEITRMIEENQGEFSPAFCTLFRWFVGSGGETGLRN
jgi:16S rRNA (adenine1518-N6/adenine1519-N6)-dimethyltransferase